MLKIFLLVLMIGLLSALYVLFDQSRELDEKKHELNVLVNEIRIVKDENNRFRVVNAILNGATHGIHGTKPETIKEINRVISHILESKSATEVKFGECFNRKMETTQWGSDGPFGVLDECIDFIADAKSAILLRQIDRSAQQSRFSCSSEVNGRFEAARNCLADRDFRLLMSANNSLFSSLTIPKWIEVQKSVVSE